MPKKSFYKQTAKVDTDSTTTVLEVEKPAKFTKSDETRSLLPYSEKWGLWLVLAGLIVFLVMVIGIAGIGWWYWRGFETAAEIDLTTLVKQIWQQRRTDLFNDRSSRTFIILGLDQSKNQRQNELLTDTIIFGGIRRDGSVKMVPIPRDYWVDSLKTKINALYYYGQQTNPDDGVTLVSSVLTEMSGLPVDYYMVINMDSVKTFIDVLGGIDVPVVRSFTDEQYPREIDLTSTDPAVLYETVRFEAGLNHMDGSTALKFIRSRHSKDPIEGSDEGRAERQQVLLAALKKKLTRPDTIVNPQITGALYKAWKTSVKTNVSDVELFSLIQQMRPARLAVSSTLIPVEDASHSGLIYHPQDGLIKQWVYLPVDASLTQLHEWFNAQLW